MQGTGKKEKHDLLFEQFGINYEKLPVIVRQGSCILKTRVMICFYLDETVLLILYLRFPLPILGGVTLLEK